MNKYRAAVIANAFITKGVTSGYPCNHLKLQKLVYFMHYWSVIYHNTSCVDEKVEAVEYGPQYSGLHSRLQKHRSNVITDPLAVFNPVIGCRQALLPENSDTEFWVLFNKVWQAYRTFTDVQLSSMCNLNGTAWDIARQKMGLYISDEDIRQDYDLNYNRRKVKA